jgi:hypothetical protein
MKSTHYNIAMGLSSCAITAGAAIQWGAGVGLMVFGVVTIVLTLISLKVGN